MLISAELKGCVTWFIYFLDLPWVRYNCAKFHHCRICVTGFREGAFLASHSHLWAARKKSTWIGLSTSSFSGMWKFLNLRFFPHTNIIFLSFFCASFSAFWMSKSLQTHGNTLVRNCQLTRFLVICKNVSMQYVKAFNRSCPVIKLFQIRHSKTNTFKTP